MAGHVHCVSRAAMVLILRLQLNVGRERWESKRGDCGGGGGVGVVTRREREGEGGGYCAERILYPVAKSISRRCCAPIT